MKKKNAIRELIEEHHLPDEFKITPDHTHETREKDLRSADIPENLKLRMALGGNQNCGKTTLFNQLTGSNQHVGNWPGVTVEHKDGIVKGYPGVTIVDLPGIYSLSPYTEEEIVSRNYLVDEQPDAIINIVDATNLERNLYLTLQMAELGIPMVIALNMMDELEKNGDIINVAGLVEDIGIPIVPICARKGEGVNELIETAIRIAINNEIPPLRDMCEGEVHKAIHAIAHLMEGNANTHRYSPRYVATKLIEDDTIFKKSIHLSESEAKIIETIVKNMEEQIGMDREAAIADSRYQFITRVCAANYKRKRAFGEESLSNKIDKVLTHKYFAVPLFLLVMLFVFWLTFGPIGSWVSEGFSALVNAGIGKADAALTAYGIAPWVHSLVVDGVLAGVGSVLSFLPTILILFLCLSVMEDCGYMARAAFIMDRSLCAIGLNGRSFIPLITGFGCSVPAIMGSRVLDNEKDRRMTVFLIPFMSCGAKVPVYAIILAAFFGKGQIVLMYAFYLLGILIAVLYGLLLNKVMFTGKPAPFIIELPPYRLPTAGNVGLNLWDKSKDFIERATTLILAGSVVVWFLQNVDTRFFLVEDNARSILAAIGGFLAPVFRPLGFGDWKAVTALLTGFLAKESVLSTIAVLTGSQAEVGNYFTPLSAVSFLTFFLLYPPCFAAISVMKREIGRRWTVLSFICQILIAWLTALLVYRVGLFFI